MLYVIATPIGNLSDISQRALDILKNVDVVLCEDTRVTGKLLHKFGIKKKMISLHQHSTDEKMIALLKQFDNIAYTSDAGTPGISDPGNKLVAKAYELEKEVCPIPGASAVTALLSVSGLPTDKFLFMGFMPRRGQKKVLEAIKASEITICFYESPHRIEKTLTALKDFVSDDRLIVVGRELTKKFETIYRGNITEMIEQIKPKGEFTVVIAGRK
jgi:16S rRNA (cytidine1402-2'-O)-methyltransferase